MAEPGANRLSDALDGPLARLEAAREELAKQWLLRLIERTRLEEIERLPTDKLARALPDLISGVVAALANPGEGTTAHDQAVALADARGEDGVGSLSADIASLQSVLVGALRRELAESDPEAFLDAVERLTAVIGAVQAAAIEELVRTRSRKIEWLASRDELTGLPNFRWLQEQLRSLAAVQRRYGHPFALLLVDIEGLGRINAAYGEDAGDRTLKALAAAIGETVREADLSARTGGDEFCVLAPQQTAERAAMLAARLAEAAGRMELGDRIAARVAIGVAGFPEHTGEPDTLLELADEAMFVARAAGEPYAVASGR
ncbi:MAG: GGDEF domain-containing protein [Thermoleophilaceae bacterium]|nr:GGDEF domain-containing protein [Thermoleophilaceae bacterium]